jgi:hypothetical protein
MRSFLIAGMLCVVLAFACTTGSQAAGVYAVGKEECNCSSLVARGIIPDSLNKLKEAIFFPELSLAVQGLAEEFRSVLMHLAPKPPAASLVDASNAKDHIENLANEKVDKPKVETPPKVDSVTKDLGKRDSLKKQTDKKKISAQKKTVTPKNEKKTIKKKKVKIPEDGR